MANENDYSLAIIMCSTSCFQEVTWWFPAPRQHAGM